MKHSILGLCDQCGKLKKIRCYNIDGKPVWKCRSCRDGETGGNDVE